MIHFYAVLHVRPLYKPFYKEMGGNVAKKTDKTPLMMFPNNIQKRYLFNCWSDLKPYISGILKQVFPFDLQFKTSSCI